MSVTKGFRIFYGSKISFYRFVKGWTQCNCDVKEKDGDFLLLVGVYICTFICYTKPLSTCYRNEIDGKGMQGRMKPPLCVMYALARS